MLNAWGRGPGPKVTRHDDVVCARDSSDTFSLPASLTAGDAFHGPSQTLGLSEGGEEKLPSTAYTGLHQMFLPHRAQTSQAVGCALLRRIISHEFSEV